MSLSPMQEILILLEDEKKVPLFRLNRWGRPAYGALAKLKNMGFVEKEKIGDETYYAITSKGEDYFDDALKILKEKDKWDEKWRLVMFNIPETERSTRDKLRRALDGLGLGILQSSVWISPYNIKEEIEKISKKFKLEKNLKFFEVTAGEALNQQILEKSWDLPEINLLLERFIKEANWVIKKMGKGNGDRYNAKKLIFEYAQIIKKDPQLPMKFLEKNELRKQAHEIYLSLRKFAN